MFDEIGAIDLIDPEFIPKRHSIPKDTITKEDKVYDQQKIKRSGIPLDDISFLYEYYARKDCYYIQIENKGFYYLKHDIADLNVPQFKAPLTFRLRAKTHHSEPIYQYSFFAVLNVYTKNIPESNYDIEMITGKFPPIKN